MARALPLLLLALGMSLAVAPPPTSADACDYDYGTVVPLVTHRIVTSHARCHGTYAGDDVTQRIERADVQQADGTAPGGWTTVARFEIFSEEWHYQDGRSTLQNRVTLQAAGATATIDYVSVKSPGEPESCTYVAGASRDDRHAAYRAPHGTPCWPRGLLLP